jgi:hypothetical protein
VRGPLAASPRKDTALRKLEDALPNTPEITAGPVIACEASGAVATNGVAGLA